MHRSRGKQKPEGRTRVRRSREIYRRPTKRGEDRRDRERLPQVSERLDARLRRILRARGTVIECIFPCVINFTVRNTAETRRPGESAIPIEACAPVDGRGIDRLTRDAERPRAIPRDGDSRALVEPRGWKDGCVSANRKLRLNRFSGRRRETSVAVATIDNHSKS